MRSNWNVVRNNMIFDTSKHGTRLSPEQQDEKMLSTSNYKTTEIEKTAKKVRIANQLNDAGITTIIRGLTLYVFDKNEYFKQRQVLAKQLKLQAVV